MNSQSQGANLVRVFRILTSLNNTAASLCSSPLAEESLKKKGGGVFFFFFLILFQAGALGSDVCKRHLIASEGRGPGPGWSDDICCPVSFLPPLPISSRLR